MRIVFLTIIVSVFLTSALMATTYNCTPSATGQGGPADIENVINNLLADGDTVILAEGTYYITNELSATEADIILEGVTGNPADMVIDGSNLSDGDSILTITTAGNWTIRGITFQNSKAIGCFGEVSIIDGHLNMYDCIIKGSPEGDNGVLVCSFTTAASATFVNCEMFGFAHDGISSKNSAGDASNRIVTAHFCYFHDINTGNYSQAMTPHGNSTMKAYFCRFDNIGTGGTGSAIGSGTGNHPIEAYNCIITNCNSGIGTNGELIVKNCIFDNIVKDAVRDFNDLEPPPDVLIEDCTFTNIGQCAIRASGGGDIVIRRCRIDRRWGNGGWPAIFTLNAPAATANDVPRSLTLEDCVIYSPNASTEVLSCKYRDLFIRRNLVWTELDSSLYGVFHTFYSIDNEVQLLAEHNCIYKAGGPIFSSWGGTGYGCDVAPGSYTGGCNTYQTGTSFGRDKSDTGNWQALPTDKCAEIEWRSLSREFMLPVDSPHYRDYGATMMPAWLSLPTTAASGTGYAQNYTATGITPCVNGYWPEGDLNLDCVVDFADFAILAEQWLTDFRP